MDLSETKTVQCGVPQGSILDPLLFLFFINDVSLYLKDSIRSVDLYADDTTFYDIAPDKKYPENAWCLENGMLINIDKTKLMLISSRQKRNAMKDNNLTLI